MSNIKYNFFRALLHIIYLGLFYSIFMHVPQEYVLGKIICIFALVFGYLYSINNSKQAFEKTDQYTAVIDALPGFIAWIDKDLNYLGVNSKLATFFNYSESDFIGKKFGSINDYDTHFLVDKVQHLFKSKKQMIQFEFKFTKDNVEYWNLVTLQKYNKGNKAILVSIDISEHKMAEELNKLEEAKVMHNERLVALGQMAATIAHEINNPLTLISSSTLTLKKSLKDNIQIDESKLQNIVDKNNHALKNIKNIIKGVQNLARDGRGEEKKPTSLFGILDDVLIFESKKCYDFGVDLKINKSENDILFNGVPVQIGQALMILINNAIDAVENLQEKWIKVDIINNKDHFKVLVTDSGSGIDQDSASKIFDSFYTTKESGKGTGIGLHLAKKIVDYHSGEISINSNFKNTQFVLSFPKL